MNMKEKCVLAFVTIFLLCSLVSAQEIFTAIQQGDLTKVKKLVEENPELLNSIQAGRKPFVYAVINRQKDIAEYLISKGADVNEKNLISNYTPVIWAMRNNDLEMIKMLLNNGAELLLTTDLGESYLHFAVFLNRKNLVEFFLNKGINVDIKKYGNLTPLHIAAVRGLKDIAELLIQKGADLTIKSTDGATPLHYAEAAGNREMADLLKSKGAKETPREFPVYRGAYLGKKRPGSAGEAFAPELFRDIYRTHSTPAFSPDGKELYWEAIFMQGVNEASRVWYMKEENGKWTPPRVAPFSEYPSGGPAFSNDGKKLFYFSLRPRDNSGRLAGDLDLWYVEREGRNWSEPKNPGPAVNSDNTNEVYPRIAKNGTLYYKVTSSPDIIKSSFTDGKYLNREIVGDLFNTDYVDSCKSMEYIIIQSFHRRGNYLFELFLSFHKPDGTWIEPVYMGDELHQGIRSTLGSVSPDGKYIFYSSGFSFYWADAGIIEKLKSEILK